MDTMYFDLIHKHPTHTHTPSISPTCPCSQSQLCIFFFLFLYNPLSTIRILNCLCNTASYSHSLVQFSPPIREASSRSTRWLTWRIRPKQVIYITLSQKGSRTITEEGQKHYNSHRSGRATAKLCHLDQTLHSWNHSNSGCLHTPAQEQ